MNNCEEYIPVVDFFTGELICWLSKVALDNWSTREGIMFNWFLGNLMYNSCVSCLEVQHEQCNK
jgi:hypothetical protein